jgi:Lipase (class 3)
MSLTTAGTGAGISRTKEVLLGARRDLWKAHLPHYLDPFREFVLDPPLKFWTIVLPPVANYLRADGFIATFITYTSLGSLRIFLRVCGTGPINPRTTARRLLLRPNPPRFKPPSEYASSFTAFLAFTFSASADLVGALLSSRKMRSWMGAIGNFRAYLHASGVGAQLEDAMINPLYQGRLLDNFKMLHDIQEMQVADRIACVKDESLDTSINFELASAMMRFATAAYGAEMIKSTIDCEVNATELDDERQAIAFHTRIQRHDIKFLKARDGTDLTSLHHFIAVDHNHKVVVLALRGTLDISGTLIDLQAMDCSYCTGRAHQGMAEMADAVWNESGAFLINLLNEDEYKDYDLLITGHSLGAGTACLLHVKIYVEGLVPTHRVLCHGFAPPPTFCWQSTSNCDAIDKATRHCICYIHDNDCVPHLSVATIRRLAELLATVDDYNQRIWFWTRALIFWGWKQLPQDLIDFVTNAQRNIDTSKNKSIDCQMLIPAHVVVWCKKVNNGFEAIPCQPRKISDLNIFMSEDMVIDHLPEQYEDSLDALRENPVSTTFSRKSVKSE